MGVARDVYNKDFIANELPMVKWALPMTCQGRMGKVIRYQHSAFELAQVSATSHQVFFEREICNECRLQIYMHPMGLSCHNREAIRPV